MLHDYVMLFILDEVCEGVVVVVAPTALVAKDPEAPPAPTDDTPSQEFVSDNFRPSSQELEEVREGMKKLGLDPPPSKGNV